MGLVDKENLRLNKIFYIDKTILIETKNLKAIEFAAKSQIFKILKKKE